jgi:hypothetical protein
MMILKEKMLKGAKGMMDGQVTKGVQNSVVKIKETCLWQHKEWKGLSCNFTDKWKYHWMTAVHEHHKDNF